MNDDFDPNAGLFGGDEPQKDPIEEHMEYTFGKNPNRTSAISDIFAAEMLETIENDETIPAEAKPQMIFKMTANSVLDMIMESLDPDTREDVVGCLDSFIGMCIVNKKFQVDILGELRKALTEVPREKGESDDDFERKLSDFEDAWWSIPQPLLNQRNPNDAIQEEMRRYGLERCRKEDGRLHLHPGSSWCWANTPWSSASRPWCWLWTAG